MELSPVHGLLLLLVASNLIVIYLFARLAGSRKRVRQLVAAQKAQAMQQRLTVAPHLGQTEISVDPGLKHLVERAGN
jgi:hypothetical protein